MFEEQTWECDIIQDDISHGLFYKSDLLSTETNRKEKKSKNKQIKVIVDDKYETIQKHFAESKQLKIDSEGCNQEIRGKKGKNRKRQLNDGNNIHDNKCNQTENSDYIGNESLELKIEGHEKVCEERRKKKKRKMNNGKITGNDNCDEEGYNGVIDTSKMKTDEIQNTNKEKRKEGKRKKKKKKLSNDETVENIDHSKVAIKDCEVNNDRNRRADVQEAIESKRKNGKKEKSLMHYDKMEEYKHNKKSEEFVTDNDDLPRKTFCQNNKNKSYDTQTKQLTTLHQKLQKRLEGGRFRWINEQLYTSTGKTSLELFRKDPHLFGVYHKGFGLQVQSWPTNPVHVMIKWLKERYTPVSSTVSY